MPNNQKFSTEDVKFNIYSYSDKYSDIRSIAHKIKDRDGKTIELMSKKLCSILPERKDCVFIPVPNHSGKAEYTLILARALARYSHGKVLNILKGRKRENTLHSLKKKMENGEITKCRFDFDSNLEIVPKRDLFISEFYGKQIFLVDNVVDTGTTIAQCFNALTTIIPQHFLANPNIITFAVTEKFKKRYKNCRTVVPKNLFNQIELDRL